MENTLLQTLAANRVSPFYRIYPVHLSKKKVEKLLLLLRYKPVRAEY